MDDDDFEQKTYERVTITANPFDYASIAERKAIRLASQSLIGLLFEAYDGVVANGGPFRQHADARLFEAFDLLPQAYIHGYDREFMKKCVACAISLGHKLTGPTLFDLSCTMEEILFYCVRQIAEDQSPRVTLKVLSEWNDSLNQDLDFEMLYEPGLDGFQDDPAFAHLRLVSLKLGEWFEPFGNVSLLNPYFDDNRALAKAPLAHPFYDATMSGDSLDYIPPRKARRKR